MITKASLHSIHIVFVILSLLLLRLDTLSANTVGHQLAAALGKCIDNERQALLRFKAGLDDPADHLSTWRTVEDDCCKWSRLTCNNQTGHVTSLDLSNSYGDGQFRGEIGPSLLNLSYLNYLDLSHNSFYGTIPKFIGNMTQLTYLNLAYNNLNGTIPMSIGSMTKLRYLDLDVNPLSGTIPNSIGSLTKLRYLSVGSDFLNGTIPKSIGSLTELRDLYIWGDFVHGTIPSELGNLSNLQKLTLIGSGAFVENLDWLSHLSQLQQLHIRGILLAKANHWVDRVLGLHNLSYLGLLACNLTQVMSPYSSLVNSSSSSIDTLYIEDNNLNSSAYSWLFPLTSNKLIDLDLSGNMLDGIPKYLGNLCSLKILYVEFNLIDVDFSNFINNLLGCTSDSLEELNVRRSQFTGSIPDEIQKFSSLENLVVKYNRLNGTVSDKLWALPKLEYLEMNSNSLKGGIHTSQNILESKIKYIDLSNNSFEGLFLQAHLSKLYHVYHLDLSSCKVGPHFPQWIHTLKNLTYLDVADNGISDTIPMRFWDMWPSQLRYLNLSCNNISGEVPDLLSNFDLYPAIDLSSNNFSGQIPNLPPTLASLNLSRNKFHGGISFICQIVDGFLSFLDLSGNSFTGKIPDCLWYFKELKVLNLGNNYLSGTIPASIESLNELEVLSLYKNDLSGQLPMSLMNCTKLTFLDLGNNKFFGEVPVWIGKNLSRLYVLSLRSNNFFGPIPLQLCQLVYLQILDVSMNNLSGTIPSCVNNLTAMVQEKLDPEGNIYVYEPAYKSISDYNRLSYDNGYFIDYAAITWQGNERIFSSNLVLLKNIDLSSNSLVGQIPDELIDLHELLALNLSNNALYGEVPMKIGHMKKLLILDLSGNSLSGNIPSSMSEMTSLGYLNISYNNMSGKIPSSTQLQSFGPLSYSGNVGLCGPPLTKNCPGDEAAPEGQRVGEHESVTEEIDDFHKWFYIGGATGFATGFWIACSFLFLYRRGRHTFFHFLDICQDWIYVRVIVFIAKLHWDASS